MSTGTLVVLEAARAVIPTAQAVAVGHLVAVFAAGATDRRLFLAAGLVAGLLFVDHTGWLVLQTVQATVARRIDGDLRARIRLLATGLPRLDLLESREFQDRAARAVDLGMGLGWDRSAGGAATGQVRLTFRMASAFAATALLATFSPALAIGLLVASLTVRAIVRRQWVGIVDTLDADTTGQRHQTYLAEQAVFFAAKDVRLFGLSHWFAGRVRAIGMRTYAPVWRQLLAVLRRQWRVGALSVLAAGAALGVPAAAVLAGSLDGAQLAMYVVAAWGVMAVDAMGLEAYDIEHGKRAVAAADQLTASVPGSATLGGCAVPTTPPTIRFDDVVFTYPGATRPVLDGLTLEIRPGETVALVGANGAGKTTLVKLLGGLYRPDSGRITVDGVDLASLDLRAWRRRLAVLFQDFVQYPTNLRENVALSAPDGLADEAVRRALDRAGAAELLASLPRGLDTSLWNEGADGTDISGGQWQRVALARVLFAVAAGRNVLVLDEPTAHLDVRAEAEFHTAVMSTVNDVTTILVSHRLSTVRPADRIILLRDGRVAEDGSHAALLALGGDYARFFTLQAEAFSTAPEGIR